jgi:uncharacterized protein YbbC (DUF1343 family)
MKLTAYLCGIISIFTGFDCKPPNALSHIDVINDSSIPAAYRTSVYLPLLRNKRVGVFTNHTSLVGNTHLIDTLISSGINVTCIYAPEHGYRGEAEAGAVIANVIDKKTGIKVISLYGSKLKPTPEDFVDVDLLVYDIQDIGVRFYTYISSLQYFMEAAFENSKPLMILDRPNPNGFYIDGPVLDTNYRSFVGMQPIPVVYGMTCAEYAFMIAGEGWLRSKKARDRYAYYLKANNSTDTPFHFQVIKCAGYTHKSLYQLPVPPSPNLPTMASIYAYPSTCFFEGTVVSEGRGTATPFQIFGHPDYAANLYAFKPLSNASARHPKFENQTCHGWQIKGNAKEVLEQINGRIQIKHLLTAYKLFPKKDSFFLRPPSDNPIDFFFNKLAGNDILMMQTERGWTEDAIRLSWKADIESFKKIRAKYLLYPD